MSGGLSRCGASIRQETSNENEPGTIGRQDAMRPLPPKLIGLLVTSSFTLLARVSHLGVRRERVDNIKHGLMLEVRNLRENHSQRFDRIALRLSSIEGQRAVIQERRAVDGRWQGAVDTKLDAQDGRIARLEQAEPVVAAMLTAAAFFARPRLVEP